MVDLPPNTLAEVAQKANSQTLAYTYSEPVVFYEYMLDCASAARQLGIGSVMISNGYIREAPLNKLLPQLTAIKVDFKGFSEDFYKNTCNGELKPVLRAMELAKEQGIWLEIVILIIPTYNDSETECKLMAEWIVAHLGPDVPIHLSFIDHKMKTILRRGDLGGYAQMKDAGNHYVILATWRASRRECLPLLWRATDSAPGWRHCGMEEGI